ncbi:MAG: hypothetical protein GY832_38610, partial [Chloroflexi bacterium]|nr:hypothetical protein [Chloroflexota bacterium]
ETAIPDLAREWTIAHKTHRLHAGLPEPRCIVSDVMSNNSSTLNHELYEGNCEPNVNSEDGLTVAHVLHWHVQRQMAQHYAVIVVHVVRNVARYIVFVPGEGHHRAVYSDMETAVPPTIKRASQVAHNLIEVVSQLCTANVEEFPQAAFDTLEQRVADSVPTCASKELRTEHGRFAAVVTFLGSFLFRMCTDSFVQSKDFWLSWLSVARRRAKERDEAFDEKVRQASRNSEVAHKDGQGSAGCQLPPDTTNAALPPKNKHRARVVSPNSHGSDAGKVLGARRVRKPPSADMDVLTETGGFLNVPPHALLWTNQKYLFNKRVSRVFYDIIIIMDSEKKKKCTVDFRTGPLQFRSKTYEYTEELVATGLRCTTSPSRKRVCCAKLHADLQSFDGRVASVPFSDITAFRQQPVAIGKELYAAMQLETAKAGGGGLPVAAKRNKPKTERQDDVKTEPAAEATKVKPKTKPGKAGRRKGSKTSSSSSSSSSATPRTHRPKKRRKDETVECFKQLTQQVINLANVKQQAPAGSARGSSIASGKSKEGKGTRATTGDPLPTCPNCDRIDVEKVILMHQRKDSQNLQQQLDASIKETQQVRIELAKAEAQLRPLQAQLTGSASQVDLLREMLRKPKEG